MPDFLTGLWIVHGEPTPFVSFATPFASESAPAIRFVLLRPGERGVVLECAPENHSLEETLKTLLKSTDVIP
jgi:hypothetical protein